MIRKKWPVVFILLFALILIAGFLLNDKMNEYISVKMKEQAGSEVVLSGEAWVDSLFNYDKNSNPYQYSLLEFKSTGCAVCKQMEAELEKIRKSEKNKVNVVVINIMNRNSQNLMKYFGISAVPTQIILDKTGNELFRNYGFIAAERLKSKME